MGRRVMTTLEQTLSLLLYGLCRVFQIAPARLRDGDPPPRHGEPARPLPYV